MKLVFSNLNLIKSKIICKTEMMKRNNKTIREAVINVTLLQEILLCYFSIIINKINDFNNLD